MKRILGILALALVLAVVVACAPAAAPTSAPPTLAPASTTAPATAAPTSGTSGNTSGKKLVFGMVTDQNGLGDQGFNDLSYAGLKKAATDFNGDVKVVQSSEQSQYIPNLTSLAKSNADLVVGVGSLLVDAMQQVATQNPNVKFALVDASVNASNVRGLVFREQEGSFLGGIEAGMTTKSNVVGVIGGMEIPPVIRWISGFQAGVKTANPKAKVIVSYAASFGDPAKGKEIALSEYNQGADVIFEVAGGTGIGAWQAAASKGPGFYIMGTDTCKYKLAPNNALADVVKKVDVAVYTAAQSVSQGTFSGGTSEFGLKDGGMDLCPDTLAKLPSNVQDTIQKAKTMIIAGTIVPPSTADELSKFTPPTLQ
jgi:basic membrane protein A and related proteins